MLFRLSRIFLMVPHALIHWLSNWRMNRIPWRAWKEIAEPQPGVPDSVDQEWALSPQVMLMQLVGATLRTSAPNPARGEAAAHRNTPLT